MHMTEQQPAQPGSPTHLKKWHCRKVGCNRVLMEYSPDTKGVQVRICGKCGAINRLKDGKPEA